MPGSEIQIDIGKDGADIHRKDGRKLFGGGMNLTEESQDLPPLDDPDSPLARTQLMPNCPARVPKACRGLTTKIRCPTSNVAMLRVETRDNASEENNDTVPLKHDWHKEH